MERQKRVVDASVIVKLFLNEEKSDEALELINCHIKKEIIIIVPELILLEVLNTLRFKDKNEEKLNDVLSVLFNIQPLIVPIDKFIMKEAINIALEYNLTIYDAVYAALAKIHKCELVSQDKKLKKLPFVTSL